MHRHSALAFFALLAAVPAVAQTSDERVGAEMAQKVEERRFVPAVY